MESSAQKPGFVPDTSEARLLDLQALEIRGINTYPTRVERTAVISEALSMLDREVTVVGRIMSKRKHGKLMFFDLHDDSGDIQLFCSLNEVGKENFEILDRLDRGDFIQAQGVVFDTKTMTRSVKVKKFKVLTKSLDPIPQEFTDEGERRQQTTKRLLVDVAAREILEKRSKIIWQIRSFMNQLNFLEMETPILQPNYGGADAKPFLTRFEALDAQFYLRISDELYLKQLVAGGFERVFEIGKDFRNEGIDATHFPEFTMMECYWAYANYEDMMKLTEDLYTHTALAVNGTTKITFNGNEIDLGGPWERLTMYDAIKKYLNIDVTQLNDDQLAQKANELKVEITVSEGKLNRGLTIASIFDLVTPNLIQPVFITDFPAETSTLCKRKADNPELIERFEPYIGGMEIGNAYTELNDPRIQAKNFEDEMRAKKAAGQEIQSTDTAFLNAMRLGMPPMGGLGLGIDRMVMLLTGTSAIRDVLAFPASRSIKQQPKVI